MKRTKIVTWIVVCLGMISGTLFAQASHQRNFHEYELWHKLITYDLSTDGQWASWRVISKQFVDTLYVRNIKSGESYSYASASMPEFSKDSRWLAFSMPNRDNASEGFAYYSCLLNLDDGTLKKFSGVESFSFTPDSRFMLLKGRSNDGTILSLYDLRSNHVKTLPSVSEYVLDPSSQKIAYITKIAGGKSSHLEVMHLKDMRVYSPILEEGEYSKLNWTSNGLTFIQTSIDSLEKTRCDDIRIIKGIGEKTTHYSLESLFGEKEKKNLALSPFYRPRWSGNGEILFFGIDVEKEQKESSNSNVTVWHWKDKDLQTVQKNRYYENKSKSYLCAWWPNQNKWKQIADSSLGEISSISSTGEYVLVSDDRPYQPHFREPHHDWYLVDVASGEKIQLLKDVILTLYFSPSGSFVYYFKDKDWFIYDIKKRQHVNLTQGIETELSDLHYDGPIDIAPAAGKAGWTEGDKNFWVYDEYDIWNVDTKTLKAIRLTEGRENKIVFRAMGRGQMKLSENSWISAKGRDGQSGIYRYEKKGNKFVPLVYGPYDYGQFVSSANKGKCLFSKEDNTTPAELFYGDGQCLNVTSLLKTQIRESDSIKLRKSEVVYYKDSKGTELKGALFYPVNYQEGKQYPMIVKMYENLSQHLNSFIHPSAQDAYNTTNFVLQEYFVFMPDIRYQVNHPGESAVDCITSAVKEVLKKGVVDAERIGLLGHSWGAYQAAYIISQTDMFAASVAGAPLTDLISMYGSIYWESGRSNQDMFETGQARLRNPWWQIKEEFMKNSPVFQAEKIHTPLLMIFGTEDRSVDWRQGLELYITMRRMKKPCILLSYEGEGHTISLQENEQDQTLRILDYFDFYLKKSKPQKWISEGVRYSVNQ